MSLMRPRPRSESLQGRRCPTVSSVHPDRGRGRVPLATRATSDPRCRPHLVGHAQGATKRHRSEASGVTGHHDAHAGGSASGMFARACAFRRLLAPSSLADHTTHTAPVLGCATTRARAGRRGRGRSSPRSRLPRMKSRVPSMGSTIHTRDFQTQTSSGSSSDRTASQGILGQAADDEVLAAKSASVTGSPPALCFTAWLLGKAAHQSGGLPGQLARDIELVRKINGLLTSYSFIRSRTNAHARRAWHPSTARVGTMTLGLK